MNISIKTTGIELTPALSDYATEKIRSLERFLLSFDQSAVIVEIEIGKTTKHHKLGDVFRAEVNLSYPGNNLRAETEQEDLYAAIDIVKDNLAEEIHEKNRKKNSLFRRGGRILKRILRFGRE
ncbi:MAG: ribosome-associated translation inhibitor RaiA [Candidatus Vogelbacteria bacterium]|nr:ribosome-associated translation inhibitor RaiA [Candidatus Vogelbacteria bacterium]